MKLEDIIEVLNRRIEGTFILHKGMDINPKYNIYKTLYCKLYVQSNDEPKLVLEYNDTMNLSSLNLDYGWELIEKGFLEKLIAWILEGGLNGI